MSAGVFFPLVDRCRFRLTGTDRVRYLNGQCTNDVRKLTIGGPAMKACILSARGKLDAVVWIWAEPDALVVDSDAEVADALAMRLERYIVADDVTLELVADLQPEWHWIPSDRSRLDEVAASSVEARTIARFGIREGVTGLDLAGPEAPRILLALGARQLSAAEVEILRVRRGIPAWGTELGPDTLPAEAGLDRTAVDFHKGCYLGQEVVSRIESVGHANRALRGFESVSELTAGAKFDHPSHPGKVGAVLTSVIHDFEMSKTVGLCYTMRGIAAGDRLISNSTEILICDFLV